MGEPHPWAALLFDNATKLKVYDPVVDVYEKGSYLCVQLPELDSYGQPMIAHHRIHGGNDSRHGGVVTWFGPHCSHPGTGIKGGGE